MRSSLYLHGSMRFAKLYYVLVDLGQLTLVGSALLGEVCGFSSESWYSARTAYPYLEVAGADIYYIDHDVI